MRGKVQWSGYTLIAGAMLTPLSTSAPTFHSCCPDMLKRPDLRLSAFGLSDFSPLLRSGDRGAEEDVAAGCEVEEDEAAGREEEDERGAEDDGAAAGREVDDEDDDTAGRGIADAGALDAVGRAREMDGARMSRGDGGAYAFFLAGAGASTLTRGRYIDS